MLYNIIIVELDMQMDTMNVNQCDKTRDDFLQESLSQANVRFFAM